MNLEVIRAGSFEALEPEWERLDARTSPRLPFTGPLWNRLWWRHFREARALVKDTLHLYALRDEAGELRGVAPMMLTEWPGVGPLRARLLQFLGADPNVTEVRGLVCAPEDEAAVLDALFDHLERRGRDWDWLRLGGVRQPGPGFERVSQWPGISWGREVPDYLVPLPSDWSQLRAGLGRNLKESLRKCYNSLKRDGLHFNFEVHTAPEQMGPALEHFHRLHRARAIASGTVAHKDVFDSRQARSFLRELLEEKAGRNAACVFQLQIAGQVVATRLGFELGDALYLYFSGFDPAWGGYSVMTTTVAEALKWAIARRLRVVNLSPGNDVSKTRWRPQEVMLREAVVPSPSLRGPLVQRVFEGVRARQDVFGMLLARARRRT